MANDSSGKVTRLHASAPAGEQDAPPPAMHATAFFTRIVAESPAAFEMASHVVVIVDTPSGVGTWNVNLREPDAEPNQNEVIGLLELAKRLIMDSAYRFQEVD